MSDALAEISARQRELDAETAGAQDFSRLEQQLRHITEQIETLHRPADAADAAATWGADRTAFERIENKILELAQKLDASDARLDSLAAIERSIADLIDTLNEFLLSLQPLRAGSWLMSGLVVTPVFPRNLEFRKSS